MIKQGEILSNWMRSPVVFDPLYLLLQQKDKIAEVNSQT